MSKVFFADTKTAFSSRSDSELKRMFWLFRLVGSPRLVAMGSIATRISLSLGLPIKGLVKRTIFRQFCGGESIPECDSTIKNMSEFGVGTILDYSVEGKVSEDDFDATTSEIIRTIEKAQGNPFIPFSVFKVTGIATLELLRKRSAGEELSAEELSAWNRVFDRVQKICKAGFEKDVNVFIDAEESWIQPAIDELALEMMKRFNIKRAVIFNTYQLYRKDRLEFLKANFSQLSEKCIFLGAKLVRGAYMEKERARAAKMSYPSPIQDTKEDTDRDYNAALDFCMQHISGIAFCAGTHNEDSSARLAQQMTQAGLPSNDRRIWFSQLLGMSDHISYNLAASGYCVAKYVPYGPVKEVLPYLIRRAMENTSVKGQTGRELGLIIQERNRRASEK